MSWRQAIQALFGREIVTVVRARSSLGLFVGVIAVVFGVVLTGNSTPTYLPTAVDLLFPMELLVPAVAVALGYRTIATDSRRGELAILQTYPVPSWAYVLGVYLGRLVATLTILGVPLVLVGLYLATNSPSDPSFFVTQSGVDSPVIFVRFVVLTLWFGCTVLAMSLAASALAGSRQGALVLGLVVLGIVAVGLDLVVLGGFTRGFVPASLLEATLALSPTSAYRGLVFETVLSTATDESGHASPLLSAAGLAGWMVLSLAVASVAVERR